MLIKILPLLFTPTIFADTLEDITVTAEKFEKSYEELTGSVEVFDSEEIEDSGAKFLGDFLKGRTGIQFSRTGGPGQTTSTFIRGAKSEYLLVVIDGVEINDPSNIGSQFELQHIDLNNIERIELLKGSQSVYYGADALGGVLRITTKKGEKQRANLKFGYGSFETYEGSGGVSGSKGNLSYSISGAGLKSKGISAANDNLGPYFESDFYSRRSFNSSVIHKDNKNELGLSIYSLISNTDVDDYDFTNKIAKDKVNDDLSSYDQFITSLWAKRKITEKLNTKAQVSESKIKRVLQAFSSEYESKKQKTNLEVDFKLNRSNISLAGVEFERDKVSVKGSFSGQTANKFSTFLIHNFNYDKFFADVGLRFNANSDYGDHFTYKLGAGFKLTSSLTLKGNFATALKEPTLDELYSPFGGNPDLQPTESETYELGALYKIGSTLFKATYFNTGYKNQITYVSPSGPYKNLDKTKTKGLELSSKIGFFDSLLFIPEWTILRAYDENTGAYLARRAREFGSLTLEFHGIEGIMVASKVTYTGERNESDGSRLPSYTLVDLYGNYRFNRDATLNVTIGNLLDKDYEEVRYYGTPGLNINGSVRFNF